MEKITYRKTLDVHKNGIQFLLQGFENADNLSRVVEISLMQSGDAIDFPEEKVSAWMYVTVPGEKEPDIQECKIEGNKIVYEVPKISAPGIATMQIKLIEHDIGGVSSVLASPKFAVEVSESGMSDNGEELKEKFTDIEKLIAEAKRAYDERIVRIDLDEDGIFRAYYADDTIVYESDALRNMYSDEANALYYKQLAEAFAEKAKASAEKSEEVLDEVVKYGAYTLFSVDFENGSLQYVSPKYSFDINKESGELEVKGEVYTFEGNIQDIVDEWLKTKGKDIEDYQEKTNTNTTDITALKSTSTSHSKSIAELKTTTTGHTTRISNLEGEVDTLKVSASQWDVNENIGSIVDASTVSLDAGPSGDPVSFEFLAINDGEIYLSFDWYVSASGKAGQIEKAYYTISIGRKGPNDTDYTYTAQVGRTETYLPPGTSIRKKQTPKISVKRGDRVKFEIGATLHHTSIYSNNECQAYSIELFANIATPYRYKNWDMTDANFKYIDEEYEYYKEGDVE